MTDHMHTPSPAPGLLGKAYAPTFKLIAFAAIVGLAWCTLGTETFLAWVGYIGGAALFVGALSLALG